MGIGERMTLNKKEQRTERGMSKYLKPRPSRPLREKSDEVCSSPRMDL